MRHIRTARELHKRLSEMGFALTPNGSGHLAVKRGEHTLGSVPTKNGDPHGVMNWVRTFKRRFGIDIER